MEKEARNKIQRATQAARRLLEQEFREQLEGTYEILPDGTTVDEAADHLEERVRLVREQLMAAIRHKRQAGLSRESALDEFVREAAFTMLNRMVALKMLEARSYVQECVSSGEESSGFREFTLLAPALAELPDKGYRLYLESLFDEIGLEVLTLFERRDPTSALWPDRHALQELLGLLNAPELSGLWGEDETIGWVYQFFNEEDERRTMRKAQAPRNSHELAVRNQFFTPRYVVQFLADNTLGRTWNEMMDGGSNLSGLEYLVERSDENAGSRAKKDPRDLRILDPACGSGHFLLYAFDLLLSIYEEAWSDPGPVAFSATGRCLREDYPDWQDLRIALPELILRHNLYGVDVDPRAVQIAAFALWMRAQRSYEDFEVSQAERVPVTRTNIVVAEPMPKDEEMLDVFSSRLDPPLLGELFRNMVKEMKLAGEMGSLLKIERALADNVREAREQYVGRQKELEKGYLPGLEPDRGQGELDLSGINDEQFFHTAEEHIVEALRDFAESASGAAGVRQRLFAGDAAQGVAFIDVMKHRYDVVLMNPPFGDGSTQAKSAFGKAYPRTKKNVYAAFVERGIELLEPHGTLGAITSRSGFFVSSFQQWREEVLLREAPPIVVADLGQGVLDGAMVEVAAYCLEAAS